LIAADLPKFVL